MWLNGRTSGHHLAILRCPEQQKGHTPSVAGMPMTALLCRHCFSQRTSLPPYGVNQSAGRALMEGMMISRKTSKNLKRKEEAQKYLSPMSRSLQDEMEKAHSSLLLLPSTGSFLNSPRQPQNCNHPLASLSILNVPSLHSVQKH